MTAGLVVYGVADALATWDSSMLDGKIQYRVMHKAATPLEYQVYRAGLEWDLLDPIVIEKRDDLKSESKWRDRVEPYNHQVTNLITFYLFRLDISHIRFLKQVLVISNSRWRRGS